MVSESPGRNASERIGGPEILKPWRPSLTVERRRQHGPSHLADAAGHPGGGVATASRPGYPDRQGKASSPHLESGGDSVNLKPAVLGRGRTAGRGRRGTVVSPRGGV